MFPLFKIMIAMRLFLTLVLSAIVPINAAAIKDNASTNASTNASMTHSQITVPSSAAIGVAQLPNIFNDSAVDANAAALGYELRNVSWTPRGLTGLLYLKEATNIYGYDFDTLNLTVSYQADTRLNVHIEPVNMTDVFVLPEEWAPKPSIDGDFATYDFDGLDLIFEYDMKNFGFAILRGSTGEEIFSTIGNPLVFSNQFVQFNTSLPLGHAIYGLGETIHGSINEPGTVKTLYANDNGNLLDENVYGLHPVYYDMRFDSNTTHGVYWRSSAIQEIIIGEESLTWRALLGVIDLYFFSGPDPMDVTRQFVSQVGLPALQPYWSLGFHMCRWGYDTVGMMEDVVGKMKNAGIPLETIWSDIDYMDSYKDFTNDPYRYPIDEYRSFVDTLHSNNQHYVPIFDAAIYVPNPQNATDFDYAPFHLGNESDVFIKNPDDSLYIGAVWPGYTVFPDFTANGTQDFMNEAFKSWYNEIPFDGIWADMNEAASFCVGSCGSDKINDNPVHPPFAVGAIADTWPEGFNITNLTEWYSISNSIALTALSTSLQSLLTSYAAVNTLMPGKGNLNYPPYAINYIQGNHDLAVHAISPNATHADGNVEFDMHSIYGYMQEKAIYNALLDVMPDRRPFIIGRSTFSGSGKYAGHWGGDNYATFALMYYSIPQALSMGLYGIPFFGADACGFAGNTDAELCSRWMQLASFFPFYRNHNVLGAIPQEPYVWESVAEASRNSMAIRYSLLPYYYTLLHNAHVNGDPVMKALSWVFPYQRNLTGVDTQFFVGDALLVTPVLHNGVNESHGVFPGANETEVYYDWYTLHKQNFTAGTNETLAAPLGHIPFHIRGGHILPMQEPAYTTAESRNNSFHLLAALAMDGTALGKLYLDDGESQQVTSALFVDFVIQDQKLLISPYGNFHVRPALDSIKVLGIQNEPSSVTFNNETVSFSFENSTIIVQNLTNMTSAGAFARQSILAWH